MRTLSPLSVFVQALPFARLHGNETGAFLALTVFDPEMHVAGKLLGAKDRAKDMSRNVDA